MVKVPARSTYAEYLAAEAVKPGRHELIDGVIVAMADGSDVRDAIAARFATLLGTRVPPACSRCGPAQRYWIAATARARHCDGAIIWGPPAHPAHDRQATTNPVLVVEVRSQADAGDHENRRRDFQALGALQAYVRVADDARRVQVYRRDQRGEWRAQPDVHGAGQRFELQGLMRAITVDEIYADILDAAGNSRLR